MAQALAVGSSPSLFHLIPTLEEDGWRIGITKWLLGIRSAYISIHPLFRSPPLAWVTGPATDPSLYGTSMLIYYACISEACIPSFLLVTTSGWNANSERILFCERQDSTIDERELSAERHSNRRPVDPKSANSGARYLIQYRDSMPECEIRIFRA